QSLHKVITPMGFSYHTPSPYDFQCDSPPINPSAGQPRTPLPRFNGPTFQRFNEKQFAQFA
ncbi:MAG: hypothetical protein AB1705_23435, partial [Verrucomicrobiota bacterium]